MLRKEENKLELKEDPDRGVYVKDQKTFVVNNVEEIDKVHSCRRSATQCFHPALSACGAKAEQPNNALEWFWVLEDDSLPAMSFHTRAGNGLASHCSHCSPLGQAHVLRAHGVSSPCENAVRTFANPGTWLHSARRGQAGPQHARLSAADTAA